MLIHNLILSLIEATGRSRLTRSLTVISSATPELSPIESSDYLLYPYSRPALPSRARSPNNYKMKIP